MSLINASHKKDLREAGWHSRGYLPHFDGRCIPQFITLHLADTIPRKVIEHWQKELTSSERSRRKFSCKEGSKNPSIRDTGVVS